jgi:predicted nucleic acid-binding Zn ribbon protein
LNLSVGFACWLNPPYDTPDEAAERDPMAPIIHQPDPGPENLKEVLARMFTLRGWGRRSGRIHLENAWSRAIDEQARQRTRVLSLRRGVLEVEVNDSVLMQELSSFHRRRLLDVLKKSLPNENVKDLKFRVGTW